MPEADSISIERFETILEKICAFLTNESRNKVKFESASEFEAVVRGQLRSYLTDYGLNVDENPHPHIFPDIPLGKLGVEVKFTKNDSWRSVANSVFESTRAPEVEEIYVVFGKMGGMPEVRFEQYDRCVMHVRTSHVPRFELEIGAVESLFEKMKVSYQKFRTLSIEERMEYIREYARGRLADGERLWWLEAPEDSTHSLPIQARLYMSLSDLEKSRLRAEASLLCPQICKPSRSKGKYNDVALFCLTYHGVLCSQARDLFSAGSVAGKERGGNYVMRSLQNNQSEMIDAAIRLDSALFEEYWGFDVVPSDRIKEWLRLADDYAIDWEVKPSECLFLPDEEKAV